jgi:hypothetical protein
MVGTPLQTAYDSFTSKIDDDLIDKESLVFEWLKSAISKSKKYVPHSLSYVLTPDSYDGNFNDVLDDDEIELVAMNMKYEYYAKKAAYLIGLRQQIGIRDFDNLPDKKKELDSIQSSMKLLYEDIKEFRQQFNTYKYS